MIELKCDIFIEKKDNLISNIFINNLSNNNNELQNEINKHLNLFYNLFNDCIYKTQCFNDSKYKELIDNLELDYNTKLNDINKQLINKNEELNVFQNSYNNLYDNIKNNIELNIIKQYEIKENILQNQLDAEKQKLNVINDNFNLILEQKLNAIKNEYDIKLNNEINNNLQLQEKFNSLIEIKTDAIKNDYDIIINNLKNDINILNANNHNFNQFNNEIQKVDKQIGNLENIINNNFNNLSQYFNNNDNKAGELGENFIYDFLSNFLLLNNGSLVKVNGKNNAGDLFLTYNNLKCCIESKNHSINIRQENINRFINVDMLNPNYNSGIFISFKSDFVNSSNIKHFDIKIRNNKPMIFLSNFVSNTQHIILAIKVLDFILQQSTYDNNIDNYISLLTSHLDLLNHLFSINNNIHKQVNDSNKHINNAISQFETILNISSKKFKYNCNLCDFHSNNKKDFNIHQKNCS